MGRAARCAVGWLGLGSELSLVTHSALSSLILRAEELRETRAGLLIFAWTTWHPVETGFPGRHLHLVSSVLFEIA